MKIIVDRFFSTDDATISRVTVYDGDTQVFNCFGLEDEHRSVKKWGETRIPEGKYTVLPRRVGGFHRRYLKRFASFHRGMLHVQDVPGFEFILIHVGNTEKDTAGCLLLGETMNLTRMTIGYSVRAYSRFYKLVIGAAESGNLAITYRDNDR